MPWSGTFALDTKTGDYAGPTKEYRAKARRQILGSQIARLSITTIRTDGRLSWFQYLGHESPAGQGGRFIRRCRC